MYMAYIHPPQRLCCWRGSLPASATMLRNARGSVLLSIFSSLGRDSHICHRLVRSLRAIFTNMKVGSVTEIESKGTGPAARTACAAALVLASIKAET